MLRAATAGHAEADARLSNPFDTDKNPHEAFLFAVASRLPALGRDLGILGISGRGFLLRLDAAQAVWVMPRGAIAGAREAFGLFTGARANG